MKFMGWIALSVSLTCLGHTIPSASAAEAVPAFILKVEGEGLASVRKKSGIVESAAIRGKIFEGDRIITDGRSAVHLLLNDGTIVKIGLNSECKLVGVGFHDHFLSWVFDLARGSLRALVERTPEKEIHFRLETTSGTASVRGTEFTIVYDPAQSASYLYTIEGLVSYGSADCEKDHTCIDVKDGESSSLKTGQRKPQPAQKFGVKELFGAAGADADIRMSLFRDVKKMTAKNMLNLDEAALKNLVDSSSAELLAAQDRAIGRLKEQREEMHAAAKDGSFNDIFAAADAYTAARSVFLPESNGGAENLVAQAAAAKFRLGQAVRQADSAGVFMDKFKSTADHDWARRAFKMRKNFDYEQMANAKNQRAILDKALDEYGRTLEYVDAPRADQGTPGTDTKTVDGMENGKPVKKTVCISDTCKWKSAIYEFEASIEGVVAAYLQQKAKEPPTGMARNASMIASTINTDFFSRSMLNNGCFKSQQICKVKPCVAAGAKKCKPGETFQACEVKQIPVRCEKASSAP